MGREQKRREQRMNKNKKVNEEELDTSIKLITAVKLVFFVILLLFVIYYILAVFVTKELAITSKNEEQTTQTKADASSITDKILASNIFNQQEEEYYVYFYDFAKEDELVANTISGITDTKIYRVDTSNSLNSNYITEENGNKKATSIKDLKVKNPTIIKISSDKIVKYYEGSNEIYKGLQK